VKRAFLLAASLAAAAACRPTFLPKSAESILIVTIDTLRADHVGAYGSTAGATPSIDVFAHEGILFENAITPAPMTLPAHTSIFSGYFPFRTGVRVNGTDRITETIPLLAPQLADRGFATAAFVSSLVLRKESGIGRGFSLFDDQFAANAGKKERDFAVERRGEETVNRALEWIGQRRAKGEKFFAWVHLYEPHAPYEPPPPYRERFAGREYDGEIAYDDECFKKLIAGLDPASTFVLLAGDHGESLGDHGEDTHGVLLYDATIRVPLILRLPAKRLAGRRVTTQVRLTDVAPTIRRLAGLPSGDADGEDLSTLFDAPHAPDRAAFAESDYAAASLGWSPMRAMRLSGRKFIEAPHRELYDLNADPREFSNLYHGENEVRDLARALVSVVARKPLAESTSSVTDPEMAKRLASLGYISGGAAAVDYGRIDASRVDPKDRIRFWSQIENGLIARHKEDFEKAVTIFERLLASYPATNSVVLRGYAEACRFTGRLDRALALYQKVVKLPNPVAADFFGLGVTWHMKGNERKACENLERAVAMEPEDVNSWINLANGRLALKDWDAAERAFSKAAALDPKSIDAVSGLAGIAFEKKDLPTAEAYLRRGLAIAPGHPATLFNLALVETALGRAEVARQIYAELASAPDPKVAERARRELAQLGAGSP
jgi:arylsulfatase A-like enzyme